MKRHAKYIVSAAVMALALVACGKPPADSATKDAVTQAPSPQQAPAQPQGAVLRDYPSAADEAALKLNYPLFVGYGTDSARVTPFFPGASTRPVSIKLAVNGAGYRMQLQGGGCGYPVAYELTSAAGKQLAAGEYSGTDPVELSGWGAENGVAVLAFHMADGAKNNYGCNVVISKN
jgi:hypothetical protein